MTLQFCTPLPPSIPAEAATLPPVAPLIALLARDESGATFWTELAETGDGSLAARPTCPFDAATLPPGVGAALSFLVLSASDLSEAALSNRLQRAFGARGLGRPGGPATGARPCVGRMQEDGTFVFTACPAPPPG
ncbi:hypothetical protein [Frigidibacter sp. MR17.24]|uniref:hypothetical protein n=1 Tax=Frigidibacter sp. MR17.24 TaxID=3127345 RepID=UPI003012CEEF